jgi:tetratricopeptide (TPR) repeat protein
MIREITRYLLGIPQTALCGVVVVCLCGATSFAQEEGVGKPSADDVSRLINELDAEDVAARCRAARELAKVGAAAGEAVPVLFALLGDSSSKVRDAALEAIEAIGLPATYSAGKGMLSVSDEFLKRRETAQAKTLVRLAAAVLAKVAEAEAENAAVWLDLAKAQRGLGRFEDGSKAKSSHFRNALASARKAADLAPDDPAAKWILAKCHEAMGSVHWRTDKARARVHYRQQLDRMQALVRKDPERAGNWSELATASLKYADTCWHLDDEAEALTHYAKSAEAIQKLPLRSPLRVVPLIGLCAAHIVMGEARLVEDKPGEALVLTEKALMLVTNALDLDSDHEHGTYILLTCRLKLADLQMILGEYKNVKQHIEAAQIILSKPESISNAHSMTKRFGLGASRVTLEFATELAALQATPGAEETRARAVRFADLATRCRRLRDFAVALAYSKRAVSAFESLKPKTIPEREVLAQMHALTGKAAMGAEKADLAVSHAQKAISIARAIMTDQGKERLARENFVGWCIEMASIELRAKKLDAALRTQKEAMAVLEQLQDEYGLDKRLKMLGRGMRSVENGVKHYGHPPGSCSPAGKCVAPAAPSDLR